MRFPTYPRPILVSAIFSLISFAVGKTALLPWDESSAINADASLTTSTNATIIDKTYIVQLKNLQHGIQIPSKRDVLDLHEQFHQSTKRAALAYATRQTYDSPSLFVGLSLTLNNDNDLQTLKGLDNVVGVWPVQTIARPSAAVQLGHLSKKPLDARATYPGTNDTIPHIVGDIQVNNPHTMARVDDVQATGVKGKGMKIGIIDTGVDFRHPSLGGCFGPGCKIELGYDFVGDEYPSSPAAPGPTPLTTCISGGHGTHVTGIIGMEDAPGTGFGAIGVAPEATLGMYRVFGCEGGAETDIIISAMLKAADDGVDLITMSLGSRIRTESDDPFQAVTTALVEQGVAVFAAAGNDADLGNISPSSPGSGPDVFSVGSTENTKFPTTYQLTDSNGRALRYSAVLPLDGPPEGLTVQVMYYGGDSQHTTGCYEAYYAAAAANLTVDPSTVILAVKNGGCGSYSKAQVAGLYGYKYLLSYETPDLSPSLQAYADVDPEVDYGIPPITIDVQDSTTILGSYGKQPGKYKIYLSSIDYVAKSPPQANGGFMSNYSSFGPLSDLTLKPQLSAPGGQILATWPLDLNGGYAVISGTSMATPFMAACYALVKSQNPDLSIKETYALLQNSAGAQLPWLYDTSILSSAAHQGAGTVNVHNALTWQSLVTPPQLNLGTTAKTVTTNFTITNRSNRAKTYTFSHKPAGVIQSAINNALLGQQYPWYASAKFQYDSILIKGGESAVVEAYITPPQNVKAQLLPVYTGFIVVHNNYETYTIPYAGEPWDVSLEAAPLLAANVLATNFDPSILVNVNAPSVHSYMFIQGSYFWTGPPDKTNRTFSMGDFGYPGITFGTTSTVDYVRLDLVPANTSFVPDVYGFDPKIVAIPPSELIIPSNLTLTTIVGLEVATVLLEFEGPFNDIERFWWRNAQNVPPNGDYRAVVRVLEPGGTYENPDDWQSWLSAILHIDTNAPFVPLFPDGNLGD